MLTTAQIADVIEAQQALASAWTPENGACLRAVILATHADPHPLLRAHAMRPSGRQIIEVAELRGVARFVVITWRLYALDIHVQPCGSLAAALGCADAMFRIDHAQRELRG